jgi:hypothetical protein
MSIPSISSTQSLNGYIALQRAHHKRELDESAGTFSAIPSSSLVTSANPLVSAIAVSLTQLGLTPAPGTASTAASAPAITAASATNLSSHSANTNSTIADSLSANGAQKTFPAFLAQLLAAAQQAPDTETASASSSDSGAQAGTAASTAATSAAISSSNALVRGASLPQQSEGSQQVQQYRNIASTFSNLAQALSSSSSSASATSNGTSSLTTVFQNLWTSLSSSHGTSTDSSSNAMPSLQTFLQTLARNFSESGISGLRGVFVDTVV